jgi:hypothetical protein
MDFKSGTQIAYIPNHANGDINHEDVEYGFVTGSKAFVFCRYWRKNEPGILRTTSCSEATPIENLVEFKSVKQSIVDQLMIALGYMHNSKKEKF